MKQLLINNLEFAKKQENIAGAINAASCERLAETLLLSKEKVTNIEYKLVGKAQKQQPPSLHLALEVTLPAICQRCLEEINIDFSLTFDYLIAEIAPEDSDDIDWLAPAPEMNLKDLIEDELLVAMPIAPMHDKQCTKVTLESGEKENPFAILKDFIK